MSKLTSSAHYLVFHILKSIGNIALQRNISYILLKRYSSVMLLC